MTSTHWCSIHSMLPHREAPKDYFCSCRYDTEVKGAWHWRPFTLTKHFGFVHFWPWTQLQAEAHVNQQTLPNNCVNTGLAAHNRSSRYQDVLRHIKSSFPTGWLWVLSSQATHHHSFDSCCGSQSRLLYISYCSKQREWVCTFIKSTLQHQKCKNKHKGRIFTA